LYNIKKKLLLAIYGIEIVEKSMFCSQNWQKQMLNRLRRKPRQQATRHPNKILRTIQKTFIKMILVSYTLFM